MKKATSAAARKAASAKSRMAPTEADAHANTSARTPSAADGPAPTRVARAANATATSQAAASAAEGWHGWDDYAAFYDWENARTVGRRDVTFWRALARRTGGRTLELGCGTGRVLLPLARGGIDIVGIDRSTPMLARAQERLRRLRRSSSARAQAESQFRSGRAPREAAAAAAAGTRAGRRMSAPSAALVRGDIRQLPFPADRFDLVIAPYGILQSLVRDRDLTDALRSIARVLSPGGRFGLDLVPDVPRWQEYARRISLRGTRGPRGKAVTLIESVRQDRTRKLTIFDQEFIEGSGGARRVHRFSLTFRTVGIQPLRRRLERTGFRVDAVLGSYAGAAWDPRADVWVILATKV